MADAFRVQSQLPHSWPTTGPHYSQFVLVLAVFLTRSPWVTLDAVPSDVLVVTIKDTCPSLLCLWSDLLTFPSAHLACSLPSLQGWTGLCIHRGVGTTWVTVPSAHPWLGSPGCWQEMSETGPHRVFGGPEWLSGGHRQSPPPLAVWLFHGSPGKWGSCDYSSVSRTFPPRVGWVLSLCPMAGGSQ